MARAAALVTIDAPEFARFATMARSDKFGRKLLSQMRKRIKDVGAVAVDAVREKLEEPSPGDGPDIGDARRAIGAATRITVSFSKTQAGVKVSTNSRGVDAEHQGILGAYNTERFRHPVFGTDSWVEQPGNPYFGAAIIPVAEEQMIPAMKLAIDEACFAIGAVGR